MTEAAPTSQRMVDRVAAQNRWRNWAVVTLAVISAAVLVAVVVFSEIKIYGAAVDSHAASEQTVGLQRQVLSLSGTVLDLQKQNRDLLDKVNAATSPEAQQANAKATADAVSQIVRCVNNHFDVLAQVAAPIPACGAAPVVIPPRTTTTTTTVPRAAAPGQADDDNHRPASHHSADHNHHNRASVLLDSHRGGVPPMTRLLVACGVVVAIVAAAVTLTRSGPSQPRPVPVASPRPLAASPELAPTTTTVPPTTTTTVQPAAPQSVVQPAPQPGTYTVQPGDTLAAVAAAHGLDWPGLCYFNRLADCNRIYPGQVLQLKSEPPPPQPLTVSPFVQPPTTSRNTPQPQQQPSGCGAALAYLAANAAPGFDSTCSPGAASAPCANLASAFPSNARLAGCTVGGPGGGHIYIDSNAAGCPPVYENEAANSHILAGQSDGPYDPYASTRTPNGLYGIAQC